MGEVPPATAFCLREGRLVPAAAIPVSDRGFRYGQHLFETVAVRGGKWAFYARHLECLAASAGQAGFRADGRDLAALGAAPSDPAFHGNPVEGLVRVYWTAGDGAPADPPGEGRIYFTTETCELPREPASLALGMRTCKSEIWWNGWKTGNYWARLEILRSARKAGLQEVLLCDGDGFLVGACMGNAFAKIGGAWWTPPESSGARPGVTRRFLLEAGFAREREIRGEELWGAEALLVCNSRLGPCPATLAAEFDAESKAWAPAAEAATLARPPEEIWAVWRRHALG